MGLVVLEAPIAELDKISYLEMVLEILVEVELMELVLHIQELALVTFYQVDLMELRESDQIEAVEMLQIEAI